MGFEPTSRYSRPAVFKTAAFNRSAIPPRASSSVALRLAPFAEPAMLRGRLGEDYGHETHRLRRTSRCIAPSDLRPIDQPLLTPQPTGDVELDFSESGIVNGFFRAYDSGSFVPVTGGVDGTRIWLDIGSNSTIDHFDGQIELNRRITGSGRFGGGNYYFRLLPETQLGV